MKFINYPAVLVLFLSGCTSALLLPTIRDVENAHTINNKITLEELLEAHELYKIKCGGCHYLYRPYRFTVDKWKTVMPEMKTEAKLSDEEYRLLFNYVMTMQKNNPTQKLK